LKYQDRPVEGYRWFSRVLNKMEEIPRIYQVRFLLGAGRLAWVNNEQEHSKRLHRQSLSLSRELGDKRNEAWSLIELSGTFDFPEEYEASIQYAERGLELFQELDDKTGLALAFNSMGEMARLSGDFAQARKMYEVSLAMCQQTGEIIRQIILLHNLSFVDYHSGNYERAKDLRLSQLKKSVEIEWKRGAIDGLWAISGPLSKLGEPERASRMLGASAALFSEIGIDPQPGDLTELAQYEADVKSQLDEATFEAAYAEGQAMTLEQAVAYALEELADSPNS
jgi:tetratricopeptide (TPR) repeat protein